MYLIVFLIIPYLLFADIIVLLGKPGSGKGTIGARLSEELGLLRLSSGEFLLDQIEKGTDLGKKVASYVTNGDMPPDELVVEAFFAYFQSLDYANGCILDGFPRTVHQARLLQEKLGSSIPLFVLYLDVSDEVVLDRIEKRLMCEQCRYPYHPLLAPPKEPMRCDRCAGMLQRREDDSLPSITKRLEVFAIKTRPVVSYYQNLGLLATIHAEKERETVFDEVIDELSILRDRSKPCY